MFALNFGSGYVLSRAVVPAILKEKGCDPEPGFAVGSRSCSGNVGLFGFEAAALAMMNSLAAGVKGNWCGSEFRLPSILDRQANRKAKAGLTTWPKAEDIARVIAFLCSDDAKLIHGAAIAVDGQP